MLRQEYIIHNVSAKMTVHLKKAFWPKRCVLCIPASAFSAVQSIKVCLSVCLSVESEHSQVYNYTMCMSAPPLHRESTHFLIHCWGEPEQDHVISMRVSVLRSQTSCVFNVTT